MPETIYRAASLTDDYPYYHGYRDAAHAAVVQQRNLDMIANNLANLDTPGYKADRLIFNDYMTREVQTFYEQGPLRETDNPLDVAIAGEGYFQVRTDFGVRLTRDGAFRMLSDGTLTTSDGFPVLSAGGAPIALNPQGDPVHFDDKGGVYQGTEKIGDLAVVTVADPMTLIKEGANLFVGLDGNDPQTTPASEYSLEQGMLEASNVNVVREMVAMIEAHRSFESYQKAIVTLGEMDSRAATQVGKVA